MREREKWEHSKQDLGNSLKKIKHKSNTKAKDLCGPFDFFEWIFCSLLSEISWHIYRPCQRGKERMKVVEGGRQLTGPYCKKNKKGKTKHIQSLCGYFFWSHFIEIFHRKRQFLLVLQADSWSLTSDLPNCFILGAVRSDLRVHVSGSSLSARCA